MKIRLWIVTVGVSILDIDATFNWETSQIPLVGDDIEVSNSDDSLYFTGEVVKRTFTSRTEEVLLDIEVSDSTADMIQEYLKETRKSHE